MPNVIWIANIGTDPRSNEIDQELMLPAMFKSNSNKRIGKKTASIGCGYLLKLSVGTSILMIINSYIIGKIVEANLPFIPDLFHDVRLFQFCQIFFPFIMVIIQFWIYDRIKDWRIIHSQP